LVLDLGVNQDIKSHVTYSVIAKRLARLAGRGEASRVVPGVESVTS
jgi:hypothetical protein